MDDADDRLIKTRHPRLTLGSVSKAVSVRIKDEYPPPVSDPSVQRILIAEDDARLAGLLREYFVNHGFAVEIESRGARAVERILQERPDLVILDLMLPDMSGFDVCRRVRDRCSSGILMLTASKAEVDQTVGLDLGADDYVIKPVEPRILLARVRSLLRRLGSLPSNAADLHVLSASGVTLKRDTRNAQIFGRPIELTMVEFEILWLLIRYSGEVVTREQLCLQARGVSYDGIDRGIDVHVSRVRRKLEAHGFDGSLLKSVRGLGYLLIRR